MPIATDLVGIILGLLSAVVWGGADFTGGYASRRSSPFQVLILVMLSGLVILVCAALALHESFPSPQSILYSVLGGAVETIGLASLYRALSLGSVAVVASTGAIISAALPVTVGIALEGLPAPLQLVGFGLALAGIWLVSSGSPEGRRISRQGLFLAVLAGVGFGGWATFLGLVEPGYVFTPLIVSRLTTLAAALLLIWIIRVPMPGLRSNPYALLGGVLDAGGNLFYLWARQFTRLDIAALLSSLYPASTVVLGWLIFKEKLSLRQGVGVALCLAAIGLIVV